MLGNDFHFWAGQVINLVFDNFKCDRAGMHGVNHWRAVYLNGLAIEELMPEAGIDLDFVRYFALLHDSQRENDGPDPEHGQRAAEFIGWLERDGLMKQSSSWIAKLRYVITYHSAGLTAQVPPDAIATSVCWDADRLDYERTGHKVDPNMLCTDAAREILLERTKC